MLTIFMNCSHSSSCHLFLHHFGILVIAHFRDLCSARFLRFGALRPKVAFFATVETRSVSTMCSVPVYIHGIWVPLRGRNPCWWRGILTGPSIGSWQILTSSYEHLVLTPSPINGNSRILPVL